jgi:hypothetical protein
MIPTSRETHAAYVQILAAFHGLGDGERLRARSIYAMFPDVKQSLMAMRLTRLESKGCIERDGGVSKAHGGRGYVLGPKSLPPFDDSAARAEYETARAAYALLAAVPDGLSASELLARSGESVSLAVMSSRLAAWERAGKVLCVRSDRPYRWYALLPALLDYDAMCAAEMARRAKQPAIVQTPRLRRVSPWLVGLIPAQKSAGSTSLGGQR